MHLGQSNLALELILYLLSNNNSGMELVAMVMR
jgi:hypothetical protein